MGGFRLIYPTEDESRMDVYSKFMDGSKNFWEEFTGSSSAANKRKGSVNNVENSANKNKSMA